jgi:threonine dehydrogenase-like Zn-dependent dehydrogenase
MSRIQETDANAAQSPSILNRRSAVVGAGAVAGLAAAAAVLPGAKQDAAVPVADAHAAKADTEGGYRLTDHIKQYYATARI